MTRTAIVPEIIVERPTPEHLQALGVVDWPIWTKEPSVFDWRYEVRETCYIIHGEVTVRAPQGEVTLGPGDLVTFPEGLSCTWDVRKAVRKHYRFG